MGLEVVGGVTLYRVWGCGSGKGTSVLLELYTAARVAIMVWYVGSEGGSLHLTEGHRPRGVPSDRNARREQDTSLGVSTQYYQHGRYLRWLAGDPTGTPSAINPDVRDSNHTGGRALDSNAPTTRDMQLRAKGAALAGLVFNVASESWHCEPLLPVPASVDITPWLAFVKGETTPTPSPAPVGTLITALLEDSMLRATQTDGYGRTFALFSGAEWINGEENAALQRAAEQIKAAGGFPTDPLKLSSSDITLISNLSRRATGIAGLRGQLEAVLGGNIKFPGADYLLGPALAGVIREQKGEGAAVTLDVDEELLGKTIAEQIKPHIVEALADIELGEGTTAGQVADELAKRLAS